MGWIVTPRGAVSVRAAQAKEGSCQHPPHTTIPLASSIFWSEETGAHIVLGEIRDEYLRHDGPIGPLGYPTSDERPDNDYPNRISHFQHGVITWSPTRGPQVAVH